MVFNIDRQNWDKSGIYVIINSINNKIYIGSSKRLRNRYHGHKSLLLKNKHPSKKLLFFTNKYGIDKLQFNLLELCDTPDLIKREQYYLDTYLPFGYIGFNTSIIAGSTLGNSPSQEVRDKISKSLKGRPAPNKGGSWSAETRLKNSLLIKPKHKELTKLKMSMSAKGGLNHNAKEVYDSNTGIFYPSLSETAIDLKYSYVNLKRLMRAGSVRVSNLSYVN